MNVDNDLILVCVQRAGYLAGPRLALFVAEWALAEAELGEIGPEEFNEWWRAGSKRTVYRRLAELREAFPEVGPGGTPAALARARAGGETRASARLAGA